MFRRKEESLFDNEFPEETESVTVITPAAANAPAAANPSAPTFVAASTVSAAPIVRPAANMSTPAAPAAANAPVAATSTSGYRPNTNVQSAPVPQVPRQSEVKSMNPSANSQGQKATSRVLTVGTDILLKGEITTCDRLVIEGKVEATIADVNTVELAECGSFKGSANVVDAQISGLFEGDLVVTGRLVIYASGKVRGNVTYGEIEIERGGELTGQIKAVASASGQSSIPKALQKAAA